MRKIIFGLFVLSACSSRVPTFVTGHTVIERRYFEVRGTESVLKNTNAATLALWVRPGPDSQNAQDLINISVGGLWINDNKSRAGFRIIPNGALQSVARADDSEQASEIRTAPGILKKNVWHHITLTIDYTGKKQEFFIDGERIETQEKNFFTRPATSDTDSLRASLGAEDDGSGSFFTGDLAGGFVDRRILSVEEIRSLMKKSRP